jgi:hypothetical protein
MRYLTTQDREYTKRSRFVSKICEKIIDFEVIGASSQTEHRGNLLEAGDEAILRSHSTTYFPCLPLLINMDVGSWTRLCKGKWPKHYQKMP